MKTGPKTEGLNLKYWKMKVNILRVLIIYFFFQTGIRPASAQHAEYKDIVEMESILQPEKYYYLLVDFRKSNPHWANVYYRIGLTQRILFSNLDPLVDRHICKDMLNSTKVHLGLAKAYIDEKEARKNYSWYHIDKVKNKDSLVWLVENRIDSLYRLAEEEEKKFGLLLYNFDKAVSNYTMAKESFIAINTRAPNLRELFLTSGEPLKQEVKNCAMRFDSCLYYLGQYEKLYAQLPQTFRRDINISLIDVKHYRMNGVTQPDFHYSNLKLWNYRKWSDSFLSRIEKEVDGMRNDIVEAYQAFSTQTTRMLKNDECIQINVDDLKLQRLVNLIDKYDNRCLLTEIYRYQMAKLNYGNLVAYENNCNIEEMAPSDDYLSRKARILKNIHSAFKKADSLSARIVGSKKTTTSFQWFFDEYMPGKNGYLFFTEKEKQENNEVFRSHVNNFLSLKRQQMLQPGDTSVYYIEEQDTLYQAFDPGADNTIQILKMASMPGGIKIMITRDNKNRASIMGGHPIEDGYRMVWSESLPASQKPYYYKIISDSSLLIASGAKRNSIKHFDLWGNKAGQFSLPSASPVVSVNYNELLHHYQVVQEVSYDTLTRTGRYLLTEINPRGSISHTARLSLPGQFLAMFVKDDINYIFSHKEDMGMSAFTVSALDQDFKNLEQDFTYQYVFKFDSPVVVKNDDALITIVGKVTDNKYNMLYSIIDYNGNILNETRL